MEKAIAIICGGGPAPGINTVISTLTKTFIKDGFKVLGVNHGYKGLLSDNPEIEVLDYTKADQIYSRGGSTLIMSRFKPKNSDFKSDFYRFVMALNLDSAFFASRAAIPFLKKGENPTIINYTSIAGWNAGGPGAGVYGTSKAAVHALTRALAKDLAEYGIRVNAVSPGTIDTDFHKQIKSTKPEVFASWKNNILLGRLGQPEDVASVVSFLVSDAAAFLTAETIQITGGQGLGI